MKERLKTKPGDRELGHCYCCDIHHSGSSFFPQYRGEKDWWCRLCGHQLIEEDTLRWEKWRQRQIDEKKEKEKRIKEIIKKSGIQFELGVLFDPIADPSKMSEEMQNDVAFYIYEYLEEAGIWDKTNI